MATYDEGDVVRISAAFTDSDDAAADPGTVTAKYRAPGGAVTSLEYGTDSEVVKDSAGNYHVDITIAASGRWLYRWEGSGSNAAAGEGGFNVRESDFS